ncbi:MAG: EpsG family protein [Paludibacteraceae bacterium]|nr:EpsG family protein [Paludibacteraceae bacterium]
MDLSISVPYFCFMAILVILVFVEFNLQNHNHRTKYVFIFSLFLFTLFVGLKGWTGMDVMMYYENYQDAPTLGDFILGRYSKDWYTDFEIGFNLFEVIAKTLGMSYWQFQFVYVLIDSIVLFYFFRRETNYCVLALLIYFIWWGWVFHAEQLRNANSVLLFMMSLKYVRNKQVFSYVLLNLLGMTFHTTSLFYIIAYPLLRITLTKNQLLWIFTVVMLVFIFRIKFINIVLTGLYTYGGQHIASKIQKYYVNIVYADSYYNIGMRKIIVCFAYVMFFFLPNYFKVSKNIDNVTKNVFVIYFILVFSLCEIRVLQDRASSLFCIGLIMLFVQYYKDLEARLHKQLYILGVIGIMIITGIKYFSVESYRYRTSFTAEADYKNYDKELERRKLEEYLDAVKRNKDVKKEKSDQLRDFDRIRAEQGIEKVKDQKLHRQKTNKVKNKRRKNFNEEFETENDLEYQEEKSDKLKSKSKDNDDKSLEESKEELREEEDEDLMEGENRDRKRQRELSDRKQNRR